MKGFLHCPLHEVFMANIGGDTTFTDIQNAYRLYETFDKNKTAVEGGKFTNLFLAHVGEGDSFEFVKKYSIRGLFMRVVSWVKEKLFHTENAFDFNKNLGLVDNLYSRIYNECNIEDTTKLDAIASKLGIQPTTDEKTGRPLSPGQVLREDLFILNVHLNRLGLSVENSRSARSSVDRSRIIKKPGGPEFGAAAEFVKEARRTTIIPIYEKRVQSAFDTFIAQNKEAHKEIYRDVRTSLKNQKLADLEPEEIDAVVYCILTSKDKNLILNEIKGNKIDALLLAMRETLSLSLPEENIRPIRMALGKIAPVAALRVENFSQFVGSAFSRDAETATPDENRAVVTNFLDTTGRSSDLVANAVTITEKTTYKELEAEVKKLKTGETRLLQGGYQGHDMVFALTKQDAGYTLQVYNQEADTILPPVLQPTADKYKGYLLFNNIPEKALFHVAGGWFWGAEKPGVLEALLALRTMPVDKAEEHFQNNIVANLPRPETGSDSIHHLLHPDLPGTQGSRALLAAAASTMTQKDAQNMVSQVDGYLLDGFQGGIKELLEKGVPKEKYTEIRGVATGMRRALEECRERLKGVQTKGNRQIREQLALYTDFVDRLEQKLIACQKVMHEGKIETAVTSLRVLGPKGGKEVPEGDTQVAPKAMEPEPLNEKAVALLTEIRANRIENALAALSAAKLDDDSYLYLCDCFFKQIGSFEALKNIQFADVPEAIKNLQALTKQLALGIDAGTAKAEQFGMFLAASYALEGFSQVAG